MNVGLKIRLLERITDELDDHMWDVFSKYIHIHKILFNGPDYWFIGNGCLTFVGTDGVMGCYDHKSITIPNAFVLDPDGEIQKIKDEKKRVEREKAEKQKEKRIKSEKEKEQREIEQLKRLSIKYKDVKID